MTPKHDSPSITDIIELERTKLRLRAQYHREPSVEELAKAMRMSPDEARLLVEASRSPLTFRPDHTGGNG